MQEELEKAWDWREKRGFFLRDPGLNESTAIRIFHGPGEGRGDLSSLSIDRFGDHYWVTVWGKKNISDGQKICLEKVKSFLKAKKAISGVCIFRPQVSVSKEPDPFFGDPPQEMIEVKEFGARYWVKFQKTLQPGLFLDHAPLRSWLKTNSRGLRVLNTFAYTGSLSVVCGLGGASAVTTLDLSKGAIEWAKQNWILNDLPQDLTRFIVGDVFEWMPRLKRKGEKFDCVILDPPSASIGKKGRFSTAQDLPRLHALAHDLLVPGGMLVSAVNSASLSFKKFESDVLKGIQTSKYTLLHRISLPETFPTRVNRPQDQYLKGFCIRLHVGN